ncbi:hypothetical protein FL857_11990 [Criibacterium bergeronii]|uniref:Uncharacterized protein n=1 Tax=Criibacterium bergeronii TaxID=1871336 RepID=A0A552UUQ1_9FIRM|nr:hypothetical protein [Criibacterium bergeronii]TRW21917.1 hypothetical protein FL857_11990 [Criibacterium bergeronii]
MLEEEKVLWNKCIDIFKKVDNNNLDEFLDNLILFIIKNKEVFDDVADLNFLDFIINIESNKFVIGTTGDNFEGLKIIYNENNQVSIRDIWRIVSNTIWDLITFTTEEVCPQCKSDNLRILTDSEKNKIYKACETCFWIECDGKAVLRSNELFPADKDTIARLK